jgi:hypothetical protein
LNLPWGIYPGDETVKFYSEDGWRFFVTGRRRYGWGIGFRNPSQRRWRDYVCAQAEARIDKSYPLFRCPPEIVRYGSWADEDVTSPTRDTPEKIERLRRRRQGCKVKRLLMEQFLREMEA